MIRYAIGKLLRSIKSNVLVSLMALFLSTGLMLSNNSEAKEDNSLTVAVVNAVIDASDSSSGTWWDERNQKVDLFYPHEAHFEVMKAKGDSCMLCHSFNKNPITNKKTLKKITTITNEPLLGICHSCHVEERSAPSECVLCHHDKTDIWPQDHNLDYVNHHAENALLNEQQCKSCHLDIAFCTDCHFKRTLKSADYHPLGYMGRHGIEVRAYSADCSRCHSPRYCSDCHGGSQ